MSSLIPGLVSITFRNLAPPELIDLVRSAELKAIEWGGDVHVPHGDTARAREVRQQTLDAGLAVAAYGSYYRLGVSEAQGLPFTQVLASAAELGAPTIRVWAGNKGAQETTAPERREIIADALRVADLAQEQNVGISLEYHANTLTDQRESVQELLKELAHPNIDFLWQTSNGEKVEACLERLADVLPRVRHAHVFHWWPNSANRFPLADGEADWLKYLKILSRPGKAMPCLLEFVRGDSPEQFLEDAATLRRLIAAVEKSS